MGSRTILIYCSNGPVLELLRRRLDSLECVLVAAETAEEVEASLRDETPAAVILDASGDFEGILALLRHIRRLPAPPECVVIGFGAEKEAILQALNAGCSYLIENAAEVERIDAICSMLIGERRERERSREKREISRALTALRSREHSLALSRREYEILHELILGKSNREISENLAISEKTVKNHLWKIYRKFGVDNRTQLFHQLLRSCRCMALSEVES